MTARPGLAALFADDRRGELTSRLVALALAALAHVAIFCDGFAGPIPREPPPKVTEVELAPPPPPPPPPPREEPARDAPAPAPNRTAPRPVARAGRLVAARSDAPAARSADAVDFVTDPEGKSYGIGVVARGGTLDRAPPAPISSPAGEGSIGAENLSRAARLEEADPCAGMYPLDAKVDGGFATASVVVRPEGQVGSVSIVSETPAGEGFGRAARACLARKTFAPARDREGKAVSAAITVRVRFTR
jgi:protein TonB